MKKVLIGVAAILVLLIAVLVAVPFFVDVNSFKPQILAQAEQATGRKLRIDGPLKLSLFPTVQIEASDIGFANAAGGTAKEMATVRKVEVGVAVMPLLSGRYEVTQFVLTDPVIALEVDRTGKGNWVLGAPAPATQQRQAQPAPAAAGGNPMATLGQVRLGDVRLVNGRVTYTDAQSGNKQALEQINLKVALPAIDQPFKADGSLVYNSKKVDLAVDAKNPKALLIDNGTTEVNAKVTSELVAFSFGGTAKIAAPLTVGGAIDLKIPSIRNLAAWAGNPLQLDGQMQPQALGPLEVKGRLAMNGSKIAFNEAAINIDAIKSKGAFEFDSGGRKPAIKATLDVEALDLNPYLPPEQPKGAAAARPAAGAAPAAAAKDDWSDDPIDLSGLRAVDADVALSAGSLKFRKIEVGKSALKVALKDGRLRTDLTELNLYQGKGSGTVTVDASTGTAAAIGASFKLDGLQIQSLLVAGADMDMLSGKGGMDVEVTTRGGTQRQFVTALNGKGGVKLNDGAVKGIDFVRVLCNPLAAVQALGGKLDPNAKTEFSEFGATYTITNGLLRNQDLAVLAPLFRATGAGTVDLPKRGLNYRAEPKLVASCSGQGSSAGKVGLGLPVIAEGPWSNVSVRPDFNPLTILQGGAAGVGDAVRGLIPGQSEGTTGGSGSSGGVGGALRGILGR